MKDSYGFILRRRKRRGTARYPSDRKFRIGSFLRDSWKLRGSCHKSLDYVLHGFNGEGWRQCHDPVWHVDNLGFSSSNNNTKKIHIKNYGYGIHHPLLGACQSKNDEYKRASRQTHRQRKKERRGEVRNDTCSLIGGWGWKGVACYSYSWSRYIVEVHLLPSAIRLRVAQLRPPFRGVHLVSPLLFPLPSLCRASATIFLIPIICELSTNHGRHLFRWLSTIAMSNQFLIDDIITLQRERAR